jgi:outer membrane protein OmpA-like peptidoglycan-associated protein
MRCYFALLFCFLIQLNSFASTKEISLSVYYTSRKYTLNSLDSIKLDSIAKVLVKAKNFKVSINSFCDSDGSVKDNLALAEKRCTAITSIFLANKLKIDSIKCNSIGELSAKKNKISAVEKEKFRRSDIVINYTLSDIKSPNETFSFTEKDLVVGKKLVLPTINFVNGTAELLVTSFPSMLELLKVMKKYPSLEIEIGGHVCCSNNFPISEKRAYNVYSYLRKNGISEKRMKYKGYGKTQPIFIDDTDEEKAKVNRRVEITILKY